MPGVSDARADVWILGPGSDGISIACRLGDELHLRLPEDLSVGRTWAVDRPVIGTLDAPPQPRLDLLWDGNQDFSSANNQTARPVGSNAAEGMDLVYDAHLGADATATAARKTAGSLQNNRRRVRREGIPPVCRSGCRIPPNTTCGSHRPASGRIHRVR